MYTNGSLFLIGIGIGFGIALLGGVIEYWVSLRPQVIENGRRLPGCLLYVSGGLVIAGIVAMIGSFILTGGVGEALIVGGGVLIGFYLGFFLMFSLWFLLNRQ